MPDTPLPADTTAEQDRASASYRLGMAVLPPSTTSEQDRKTAGQRRINLVWESTQAVLAVMVACAMIYCAINKVESKEINYAFISIITMYYVRTNHTKIGGVGGADVGR
jgi:hypothetical protein